MQSTLGSHVVLITTCLRDLKSNWKEKLYSLLLFYYIIYYIVQLYIRYNLFSHESRFGTHTFRGRNCEKGVERVERWFFIIFIHKGIITEHLK
jgi:hypothetical protein